MLKQCSGPGNFLERTSSEYCFAATEICCPRSICRLTNLGVKSENSPTKSSVTKICPSQAGDTLVQWLVYE